MDYSQHHKAVYSQDVQYKEGEPHCYVQWKGTDVCMDVHCECGEMTHFDGDFCYYMECGACGKVYAVGDMIKLIPLDKEQLEFVKKDRPNLIKVSQVD